MEFLELIKYLYDLNEADQANQTQLAANEQLAKHQEYIEIIAKQVDKNTASIQSISSPFGGYTKEQLYMSFLDLMFFAIILTGILLQFRVNGKKIKKLTARIDELEKNIKKS